MYTTRATAALLAFLLVPSLGAAQGEFEGEVNYRLSGQGMNVDMLHYIRGEMVRQEMSGPMGAMAMIIDLSEGTMTTLMPAQKMYITMDVRQLAEQTQHMSGQQELDIEETGRSDSVAGHRCEYYVMKTADATTEICAAKGLGYYMVSQGGAGGRPGAAAGAWDTEQAAKLRARFKDGFFPLKMVMTPANGSVLTLEVTSLERKRLSDDLFAVPAGYTKMPGFPGN